MKSATSRIARAIVALTAMLTANVGSSEVYWPPIADPPTGLQLQGKWVWAELITRDVGLAAEFYGRVFGWTFETFGPENDLETYTLVLANGEPIGGMLYDRSDKPTQKSARWVGLISVADAKAARGQVERGGGRTLVKPRKFGARGEAALFTDPEGAMFGVIRSASGDPEDWLGAENTWLWAELWADDPLAMGSFYQSIGAYELLRDPFPQARGVFHLASAGYARAGIRAKPIDVPSTWIPYVRVADVERIVSLARAAGAQVVMEPVRVRGTTAALLLDPSGAPFAVAEWPASPGDAP